MREKLQISIVSGIPLGSHTIHFYFGDEQRRRFLSLLTGENPRHSGLVLACKHDEASAFAEHFSRRHSVRGPTLTRVEITHDWHRNAARTVEATHHAVRDYGSARVLADFGAAVPQSAIHELESLLTTGLSGLDVSSVSQYDGTAMNHAIPIDALARFGQVVFSDFYAPLRGSGFAVRVSDSAAVSATSDVGSSAEGD